MPVLIWELEKEEATSHVETAWAVKLTVEELREEAEALDRRLDAILDRALTRVAEHAEGEVPQAFVRAWAIGRSLTHASVFEEPALRNEPAERLWKALAAKCRTGLRASGTTESAWAQLRPGTEKRPRREGRKLDYFDMCVWLANQDFHDAVKTFGGYIRNVWQMLERRTLNPPVVRHALLRWLDELDPAVQTTLTRPKVFPEMMKRLRARWPDRGPGSAKRPLHFTEDELLEEIRKVLEPLAEELDVSAGTGA